MSPIALTRRMCASAWICEKPRRTGSRVFVRPERRYGRCTSLGRMTTNLEVLQCGKCEPLKLGVHALALGLVAVMGLYNAAAWLSRRQKHLAFNAVMYAALTVWEQQHVAHHIAELRRAQPTPEPTVVGAISDVAPAVAVALLAASDIAA